MDSVIITFQLHQHITVMFACPVIFVVSVFILYFFCYSVIPVFFLIFPVFSIIFFAQPPVSHVGCALCHMNFTRKLSQCCSFALTDMLQYATAALVPGACCSLIQE